MHSILTEKIEDEEIIKKHKRKTNKRRDQETRPEHTQTEWVLCSEDWRDIVITYVPDLNNIPMEENYAEISQEGLKTHSSNLANAGNHTKRRQRETTQKEDKEGTMIANLKFSF